MLRITNKKNESLVKCIDTEEYTKEQIKKTKAIYKKAGFKVEELK